jgi:hypothetical protein
MISSCDSSLNTPCINNLIFGHAYKFRTQQYQAAHCHILSFQIKDFVTEISLRLLQSKEAMFYIRTLFVQ